MDPELVTQNLSEWGATWELGYNPDGSRQQRSCTSSARWLGSLDGSPRRQVMHNLYYPSEVGRSPVASTGAFHPALAAVEVSVAGPHTPAPVARDALTRPLDLASTADRPAAAGTGVRALVDVPPAPGPAAVDGEGVGVSRGVGHGANVGLRSDTPPQITDPAIRYGQAVRMARQRKGWAILTRLPAREEELVRARAAEQGLSYSDVIANAVAVGVGRPPIHEPRHDLQDQLLAS